MADPHSRNTSLQYRSWIIDTLWQTHIRTLGPYAVHKELNPKWSSTEWLLRAHRLLDEFEIHIIFYVVFTLSHFIPRLYNSWTLMPLLLHVVPGTCCSASINLTWCHGKMITCWGHDISNKNSKATWGHQLPVCLRLAETRHLLTSAYLQLSLFQHHSFFLQHAPDLRPDLSHIRNLFIFCLLNNILLISPLLMSYILETYKKVVLKLKEKDCHVCHVFVYNF